MPWEELDGMDDMTPEEIIGAALSAPSTWPVLTGSERVVKALADAGKVIVDREKLAAILRDVNTYRQDIDVATVNNWSIHAAMIQQDTGS